jgi:hydrogenase-4 component F
MRTWNPASASGAVDTTGRPASDASIAPALLVAFGLLSAGGAGWLAVTVHTDVPLVLAAGFVVVDATSRLFLLLVNAIFLGVATYVWSRVRSEPSLAQTIGRYAAFAVLFVATSNLAVLSNHLIVMWALLELTTLAAVPLIQHGGGDSVLLVSWKYFLFSSVGLALVSLGLVFVARAGGCTGHGEFSYFIVDLVTCEMRGGVWQKLGVLLLLLGLGTKLGLAPMYSWLPDTYEAAPPATTALLGAIQFNVALVYLLRVMQAFRSIDPALVRGTLLGMGLATMAVSALHTVAATKYKRLIAYAALNHGGVIAVGLALGGDTAYGVILYAVSNAFIKAILFLTAGKIRSHYQTDDLREVGGLIKDLPYSGAFFMVGVFALLGLPPFGSFLGELIILSGLIRGGFISVFSAFCVILTVTFVATGRAVFPMIWGESKKRVNWASQPLTSVLPKLLFFCALVAMGLYLPPSVNALFRQVAAGLGVSR